MNRLLAVVALSIPSLGLMTATIHAQGALPVALDATLFQNVRIFDGKSASLSAPSNVLVRGNRIERIFDGADRS